MGTDPANDCCRHCNPVTHEAVSMPGYATWVELSVQSVGPLSVTLGGNERLGNDEDHRGPEGGIARR